LRLRRLAKSILRRCSPEEIVAADGDWRLICAWACGDLHVLETLWKQLGIDAIVRQQADTRPFGFDVERALFALVIVSGVFQDEARLGSLSGTSRFPDHASLNSMWKRPPRSPRRLYGRVSVGAVRNRSYCPLSSVIRLLFAV
jgi:hypothetical protein